MKWHETTNGILPWLRTNFCIICLEHGLLNSQDMKFGFEQQVKIFFCLFRRNTKVFFVSFSKFVAKCNIKLIKMFHLNALWQVLHNLLKKFQSIRKWISLVITRSAHLWKFLLVKTGSCWAEKSSCARAFFPKMVCKSLTEARNRLVQK